MVGDPQQLPATVLSRQAQLANMERSMFERYALPLLLSNVLQRSSLSLYTCLGEIRSQLGTYRCNQPSPSRPIRDNSVP